MWILEKCENAWTSYFTSHPLTTATVSYLNGVSITDKEGPIIVAVGQSAEEIEIGSGIYAVSLTLSLRIPAEDTQSFITTRNALVDEFIETAFSNSILTDLRASATNLTILDVMFQGHNNEFQDTAIYSNVAVTMYVSNTA